MCICILLTCNHVQHLLSCCSMRPEEGVRWMPWNWSYQWLWGTQRVLGIGPGSSKRALVSLNCWAISSAFSCLLFSSIQSTYLFSFKKTLSNKPYALIILLSSILGLSKMQKFLDFFEHLLIFKVSSNLFHIFSQILLQHKCFCNVNHKCIIARLVSFLSLCAVSIISAFQHCSFHPLPFHVITHPILCSSFAICAWGNRPRIHSFSLHYPQIFLLR